MFQLNKYIIVNAKKNFTFTIINNGGWIVKLKKSVSSLCALAVMLSSGVVCSAGENEKAVRILSVGDSITDGYGTDGSYRKFLYRELTDEGWSVDMTGPNWSWGDAEYTDEVSGETFSYDAAHCGFSGYAIEEYSGRSGIRETVTNGNYLEKYSPDIVILQIGTNDVIDNHDIDSAGKRLDTLVTYILDNISEDAALFVTTIPDLDPNREDVYAWFSAYRHSADWSVNFSDEEAEAAVHSQVAAYNSQVRELVAEKQKSGVRNIYSGDIFSVLDDVSTQLKDGVHPNNTGYRLMGKYWAGVIEDYLSGAGNVPPADVPPAAEKITGDVNLDGVISVSDLIALKDFILSSAAVSGDADMNGDEVINIIDFILLKNKLC